MIEVRLYDRARDRDGFAEVRSQVYRGGGVVRPDEELLHEDVVGIVGLLNGRVVSSLSALRFTCSLGDEDIPTAAIAAVGVIPEFRQTGIGSVLMNQGLEILEQQGFRMASLYPFSGRWYRRFGFEYVGRRLQLYCPTGLLPTPAESLPIYRLAAKDFDQLRPVETAMARTYPGYNRRTDRMWWRSLGGDTPLTIYAVGDPIEAYATIRLRDDFWGTQELKELAWSTERGYQSMLGFCRSLCLNHNGLTWPEPDDSPFLQSYLDHGVTATVSKPWMMRILNPASWNCHEPVGPFTQKLLGQRAYMIDYF